MRDENAQTDYKCDKGSRKVSGNNGGTRQSVIEHNCIGIMGNCESKGKPLDVFSFRELSSVKGGVRFPTIPIDAKRLRKGGKNE